MAEKIGFISFSAFDLKQAQEFDAIKTRLYREDKPARSYFEMHPALPPWKKHSTLGHELMVRRTPSEMQPLMNEYHKYFLDKAVQHEHYLRWWRRHHAWNREAEIFLLRFEDLRDYLNESWNRQAYMHQGRIQSIFRKAAERSWEGREIVTAIHDEKHMKSNQMKATFLAKKTQNLYLLHQNNVVEPDRKYLFEKTVLRSQDAALETRELLHSPLSQVPKWAHLMAIADYAQKSQIHQSPTDSKPSEAKAQTIEPPPALKKGGRI